MTIRVLSLNGSLMDNIYLCEPAFLESYLFKIENATKDEIQAADRINNNQSEILSIKNDTAFIDIIGVLSKTGPSALEKFFGITGVSLEKIIESIELIKNEDSIKKVILRMDTPGGTIPGIDETFQAIQALTKIKPVIVENHGILASGGFFIASPATKIVATAPTVETGSIGVIIAGIDTTEFDKKNGFKIITIRSSNAPNKNPDITTKEGQKEIQERVDALEKVFIKRVAEGRGVTEATVKKDFGRGGLLIAEDALEAGMIDDIITSIKDHNDNKSNENILQEHNEMNLKELVSKHPELKDDISKLEKSSFDAGVENSQNDFKTKAGKVTAYLKPDTSYPPTVVNKAIGFLTGDNSFEILEATAAAVDAVREATKSQLAQGEQGLETPPQGGEDLSTDGVIRSEADMSDNIKKLRSLRGAA